jgi:hypothetical protein
MPQVELVEMFFDYALPPTVVLANTTVQPTIVIGADADFQVIWLIANSTGTFSFTFSDGSTGRLFMSGAINNVNLFGSAANPFPMLPPYVFKRQGSIQLVITDTSGANNTIQVVFSGKKIFPTPTSGSAGTIAQ